MGGMLINNERYWPIRVFGADGKEYQNLTSIHTDTGEACQIVTDDEGHALMRADLIDLDCRYITIPLPLRFGPLEMKPDEEAHYPLSFDRMARVP